MKMTVHAHRADPVHPEAPVNTAIIRIVDPLPAGRDHDAVDTHQRDAAAIVDALWATLPGATIDRVVAQMLERTAGRLRVPHQRAGDR